MCTLRPRTRWDGARRGPPLMEVAAPKPPRKPGNRLTWSQWGWDESDKYLTLSFPWKINGNPTRSHIGWVFECFWCGKRHSKLVWINSPFATQASRYVPGSMQIGHRSSSQAPQLPVPAIQDLIVATSLPQGFPTISHSSPQDRKHWGTWVLSVAQEITIAWMRLWHHHVLIID